MSPHSSATRRAAPGRPRDPRADDAILEATQRLLARNGYDRTSIDAIADETGHARATIYRRYGTKLELARAAISRLGDITKAPQHEDLHTFLIEFTVWVIRQARVTEGPRLLASVIAQEGSHPELAAAFRERVMAPAHSVMRKRILEARAAGQIRPDTDPDEVIAALIGAFLYWSFYGDPTDARWPRTAVDNLWPGIATPS